VAREERLFHHDLCFGCGQGNPFGLQLELRRLPAGGVTGRFFAKQDHQGRAGYVHGGVLAAALEEAMSLLLRARGTSATTGRLEVELHGPVPVGTFVALEADLEAVEGGALALRASAAGEGGLAATARGTFVEAPTSRPRD
jgi:acyl-coenzyme A thioesterase PaaI-like protein